MSEEDAKIIGMDVHVGDVSPLVSLGGEEVTEENNTIEIEDVLARAGIAAAKAREASAKARAASVKRQVARAAAKRDEEEETKEQPEDEHEQEVTIVHPSKNEQLELCRTVMMADSATKRRLQEKNNKLQDKVADLEAKLKKAKARCRDERDENEALEQDNKRLKSELKDVYTKLAAKSEVVVLED